MRKLIKFPVLLLCLLSIAFSISLSTNAQSPQAKYILALSDVDMVATAYIDGNLGSTVEQPDTLSIIPVPFRNTNQTTTIEASNSVFSPPAVMDVTPNGKLALVIETWQPRPQNATQLDELVPGNTLRGFDLNNPNNPQAIGAVEVNHQPQAIAISPDGSLAAIAGLEIDEGLTFVALDGENLGKPQNFALNLPERSDLPTDEATFIQWHPSGGFLAVNLVNRAQVAFYEVISRNGNVTVVRPYGNIVQVNKYPLTGCFTPDGKYYITSDLQWGEDVPGFFGVNRGTLTTIRLASPEEDKSQNLAVAVTEGGSASETIAVSPDGQFLVSSNMRNTGLLESDPSYDREASLNLYSIDSISGILTKLGEWKYEATLPQGLIFDPSGDYLYVGVNAYDDNNPLQGGVEVWQVVRDNPQLKRTNTIVRAPRGVHTLAAIE